MASTSYAQHCAKAFVLSGGHACRTLRPGVQVCFEALVHSEVHSPVWQQRCECGGEAPV